jgi:uncharacterized protein
LPGKLLKAYDNSDAEVYRNEFLNFLPEKIFDSHIHLWDRIQIRDEISQSRQKQNPFLDDDLIDGYTIQDFKIAAEKLFPGKTCTGLFFGLPLKEFDLEKTNKYISGICKKENCYGLYMPVPALKEIPENFFADRFIGFKPYPDLAEFREPEDFSKLDIDISIFDFVPKIIFDFANRYGLIILLHLPRKGRLSDKRNIRELDKISEKYPNVKIILAHAGRSYCYEDIKHSINEIKHMQNLYMDTAMVNDFLVNRTILDVLGPDKLLFGSDSAISLLKGKNIEINNTHYFVTKEPKQWSLSSASMTTNFTFFLYETIRAIKMATEELKMDKTQVEKIFYSNITGLIQEIKNKIY